MPVAIIDRLKQAGVVVMCMAVGILTFLYGIAAREAPSRVSYAETHIPVG